MHQWKRKFCWPWIIFKHPVILNDVFWDSYWLNSSIGRKTEVILRVDRNLFASAGNIGDSTVPNGQRMVCKKNTFWSSKLTVCEASKETFSGFSNVSDYLHFPTIKFNLRMMFSWCVRVVTAYAGSKHSKTMPHFVRLSLGSVIALPLAVRRGSCGRWSRIGGFEIKVQHVSRWQI